MRAAERVWPTNSADWSEEVCAEFIRRMRDMGCPPAIVRVIRGKTGTEKLAEDVKLAIIRYMVKSEREGGAESFFNEKTPEAVAAAYGLLAMEAATYGSLAILQYLVAQGASLVEKDRDGRTVFHHAKFGRDLRIVQYALETSAAVVTPRETPEESRRAYLIAHGGSLVEVGTPDILRYLLENGIPRVVSAKDMVDLSMFAGLEGVRYFVRLEVIFDCAAVICGLKELCDRFPTDASSYRSIMRELDPSTMAPGFFRRSGVDRGAPRIVDDGAVVEWRALGVSHGRPRAGSA